jgi:hypothetical protein
VAAVGLLALAGRVPRAFPPPGARALTFAAGSLDAARETAHRAGLAFDNVAEMVSSDSRGDHSC